MAKVPGMPTRGRAKIWPGPIPGTHEPGWKEPPLIEQRHPEELRSVVHGDQVLELHYFRFGELTVLMGHEPCNGGPLRWHLSISHPHRHPSWDEIKTVRYRLMGPHTSMAMLLPPADSYVNVERQDHVFQLYELLGDEARDAWVVP